MKDNIRNEPKLMNGSKQPSVCVSELLMPRVYRCKKFTNFAPPVIIISGWESPYTHTLRKKYKYKSKWKKITNVFADPYLEKLTQPDDLGKKKKKIGDDNRGL